MQKTLKKRNNKIVEVYSFAVEFSRAASRKRKAQKKDPWAKKTK